MWRAGSRKNGGWGQGAAAPACRPGGRRLVAEIPGNVLENPSRKPIEAPWDHGHKLAQAGNRAGQSLLRDGRWGMDLTLPRPYPRGQGLVVSVAIVILVDSAREPEERLRERLGAGSEGDGIRPPGGVSFAV